eukprot:SAG31_NODE_5723_length_2359_cov_1.837168_1_plen_93_part_00
MTLHSYRVNDLLLQHFDAWRCAAMHGDAADLNYGTRTNLVRVRPVDPVMDVRTWVRYFANQSDKLVIHNKKFWVAATMAHGDYPRMALPIRY